MQETTDNRKRVHVEPMRIRWGDMDALGHVNNVTYFRYMEQARIGFFEKALAGRLWVDVGLVIANATCEFKRALTYPGDIEVSVFVETPGASSLKTFYEICMRGDPKPYTEGSAVVVFVDPRSHKPTRIPQAVRDRLVSAL